MKLEPTNSPKLGLSNRRSSTPELVSFIEPERLKKISICSRKLGLASEDIVKAVNSLDVKSLSSEQVAILLGLVPNDQEIRILLGYSSDPDQLCPEDRWLLPLCRIERYEAKLNILSYVLDFEGEIAALRPQIQLIRSVTDKMMKSERLETLLDASLALVNYSNSGKRPPAVSLTVDGLNQLATVRSNRSGKPENLLAYVIQQLNSAGHSKFYDDLQSDVEQAAKVSIESIKVALKELRSRMKPVQDELDIRRKRKEDYSSLERFQKDAQERLNELAREVDEADKNYVTCLAYYGEPFVDSDVYFGSIAKFIRTYQEAENRLECRLKQTDSQKK